MSDKLRSVCEQALGVIYDYRQTQSQQYVESRVFEYNQRVHRENQKRKWLGWLGVKPKMMITPHGMEQEILHEMQVIEATGGAEALVGHPMVGIQAQYGDIEHQTKDCMIQCAMNESVAVSADLVRGISHLGLPLDFCKRRTIGFLP